MSMLTVQKMYYLVRAANYAPCQSRKPSGRRKQRTRGAPFVQRRLGLVAALHTYYRALVRLSVCFLVELWLCVHSWISRKVLHKWSALHGFIFAHLYISYRHKLGSIWCHTSPHCGTKGLRNSVIERLSWRALAPLEKATYCSSFPTHVCDFEPELMLCCCVRKVSVFLA